LNANGGNGELRNYRISQLFDSVEKMDERLDLLEDKFNNCHIEVTIMKNDVADFKEYRKESAKFRKNAFLLILGTAIAGIIAQIVINKLI
jgi:hypothetical protein